MAISPVGSISLAELDGTPLQGTAPPDWVKKFFERWKEVIVPEEAAENAEEGAEEEESSVVDRKRVTPKKGGASCAGPVAWFVRRPVEDISFGELIYLLGTFYIWFFGSSVVGGGYFFGALIWWLSDFRTTPNKHTILNKAVERG